MSGYEVFEGWIEKLKADIEKGADVKVAIKDLQLLIKMNVLAKIAKSKDDLPDGENLRVVNDMGEKKNEMVIKILEELGEDEFVGAVET